MSNEQLDGGSRRLLAAVTVAVEFLVVKNAAAAAGLPGLCHLATHWTSWASRPCMVVLSSRSTAQSMTSMYAVLKHSKVYMM